MNLSVGGRGRDSSLEQADRSSKLAKLHANCCQLCEKVRRIRLFQPCQFKASLRFATLPVFQQNGTHTCQRADMVRFSLQNLAKRMRCLGTVALKPIDFAKPVDRFSGLGRPSNGFERRVPRLLNFLHRQQKLGKCGRRFEIGRIQTHGTTKAVLGIFRPLLDLVGCRKPDQQFGILRIALKCLCKDLQRLPAVSCTQCDHAKPLQGMELGSGLLQDLHEEAFCSGIGSPRQMPPRSIKDLRYSDSRLAFR